MPQGLGPGTAPGNHPLFLVAAVLALESWGALLTLLASTTSLCDLVFAQTPRRSAEGKNHLILLCIPGLLLESDNKCLHGVRWKTSPWRAAWLDMETIIFFPPCSFSLLPKKDPIHSSVERTSQEKNANVFLYIQEVSGS